MLYFLSVMVIMQMYPFDKLVELYTLKCVQFKICKLCHQKTDYLKKESENVKWSSYCGKSVQQLLKKLNVAFSYNPTIPCFGV